MLIGRVFQMGSILLGQGLNKMNDVHLKQVPAELGFNL